MAVRYEGLDSYPDLELTELMLPTEGKKPIHGVLSTLITWHRNDPVDTWEENRNNIIYNSYQNNRNPFIDFPKLAEHIWGTEIGANWTGDEPLNIATNNKTSLSIYQNPTFDILNINGINLDAIGRKVSVSQIGMSNNTIDVSALRGIYVVNIITQEITITKRIIIR